jgi:hypothetical protein
VILEVALLNARPEPTASFQTSLSRALAKSNFIEEHPLLVHR